ncbi:hypothetical protein CN300_26260 [Bacillus thuringiensis]|uniref:hypothetical protein n=1 Tax=Bacillus thuringiensis TaxID=1428 RepID=UPI000BF919D9|nr:hypothetical protein [Bacillus thuringiensis]PFC40641.1 hypothetical protein CN300_26260 [Bacillus thuringiensis]
MIRNELLIFKKPTDAVGANRGFFYQYLKTLVLWVKNYRFNREVKIYCEVEDDIKEIEENYNRINYTQLKCYSSVLSLESSDVQKSLYNFFVLYLLNKDYDGTFAFETNTAVSRNDNLLSNWSLEAGRLELQEGLIEKCVSKTREILLNELDKTESSKKSQLRKKIKDKEERILKETNQKKKEQYVQDKEKLEVELGEFPSKVNGFKAEITNNDQLNRFVNRIQWEFKSINTEDSLKALEEEVLNILRDILRTDKDPNIYFCRLLTEVSKKATKHEEENRMLDNELLKRILSETDDEIKAQTSQELIEKWNESLKAGLDSVHEHLEKIEKNLEGKIDQLNVSKNYLEEYAFVELPYKESEEIQIFIDKEQNNNQSKLEEKIHRMENVEIDMKESFLEMGTEFRCRYLIYLEELKLNAAKAYKAVKVLESKVQVICTRHTRRLSKLTEIDSNDVYDELEEKLELLLNEFNKEQIKNGLKVDMDIVTGQMFHMAAKCSLRWHREVRIV